MIVRSAAVDAGSKARVLLTGWPRIDWRVQLVKHAPALTGLGLGLLTLGPGIGRGYLLSYDMVFVPSPPFSRALVGLAGGPARAVPSDAVVTVLARLLPADILQKLILLLIFMLACSGAAALLTSGWRQVTGEPAPVLARLVAGTFYLWNPFVAERLLIGQWALLLGYAGLPWVVRELSTGTIKIKPGRLLVTLLPAAVGGFAALAVTGLAAVPIALARGTARDRGRRLAVTVICIGLVSLPWLVPSLLVPVHTDPRGVDFFAARADTPFSRIGSLVMLSGIWNAQTVPRGYSGISAAAWLCVVACALSGFLLCARRQRAAPGLGLAGLVGLGVAALGVISPTRHGLRALVAAWPGFAVLRDGQQFVAALGLTEAIGLAAGVAWLLAWVRRRQPVAPTARLESAAGPLPGRPRTDPAAVSLALIALVAPVLMLPGMAWGEIGRLAPVHYPADWISARDRIDASQARGSVLVLPWGAYRRYPWNNDEAVYDPWNKLLSRAVISDDGLQVGRQSLTPETAASIRVNGLVASSGPMTAPLRQAGVRFVVIDAGSILDLPPNAVAADARLPGARLIVHSRDLIVLMLPGQG